MPGAATHHSDRKQSCERASAKKAVDRLGALRIVRRCLTETRRFCAPLAELVDALDSKSSSERSAGSIPAWGTIRCFRNRKACGRIIVNPLGLLPDHVSYANEAREAASKKKLSRSCGTHMGGARGQGSGNVQPAERAAPQAKRQPRTRQRDRDSDS